MRKLFVVLLALSPWLIGCQGQGTLGGGEGGIGGGALGGIVGQARGLLRGQNMQKEAYQSLRSNLQQLVIALNRVGGIPYERVVEMQRSGGGGGGGFMGQMQGMMQQMMPPTPSIDKAERLMSTISRIVTNITTGNMPGGESALGAVKSRLPMQMQRGNPMNPMMPSMWDRFIKAPVAVEILRQQAGAAASVMQYIYNNIEYLPEEKVEEMNPKVQSAISELGAY